MPGMNGPTYWDGEWQQLFEERDEFDDESHRTATEIEEQWLENISPYLKQLTCIAVGAQKAPT